MLVYKIEIRENCKCQDIIVLGIDQLLVFLFDCEVLNKEVRSISINTFENHKNNILKLN